LLTRLKTSAQKLATRFWPESAELNSDDIILIPSILLNEECESKSSLFLQFPCFRIADEVFFENLTVMVLRLTRAGNLSFVQDASSSPVLIRIDPGR
jgi:hypothetical protein